MCPRHQEEATGSVSRSSSSFIVIMRLQVYRQNVDITFMPLDELPQKIELEDEPKEPTET